MKAVVAAFNQEKALVGAFSVIVKTGCGTDGSFYSTSLNKYFRSACAIPDPDSSSVIITGGVGQYGNVYRYTMAGWAGALPSLNTGRYWHACGSYVTHDSRVGGVLETSPYLM